MKSDGAGNSFPLKFKINPEQLEILEVAEGSFFKSAGPQTRTGADLQSTNGEFEVDLARVSGKIVSGEGDVAIVKLKAIGSTGKSKVVLKGGGIDGKDVEAAVGAFNLSISP